MAGHDDGPGVLAQRLAHVAGQQPVAQLHGDLAIGQRLAGRDGPRDLIDAVVERRHPLGIQSHAGEVDRLPLQQPADGLDGRGDLRRRLGLDHAGEAPEHPRPGALGQGLGQVHAHQPALVPRDPGPAEDGFEEGEERLGHGGEYRRGWGGALAVFGLESGYRLSLTTTMVRRRLILVRVAGRGGVRSTFMSPAERPRVRLALRACVT
jgi:hypothetical protein